MIRFTLITSILSLTLLVSCLKPEKNARKIDIPQVDKLENVAVKKKGLKCDILGETENKEIFLNIETTDGETTVSFHDFESASKISLISANFENYVLMNFTMSNESDDSSELTGESVLSHSDLASLSEEGKVIMIMGRLTLNEDMSGKLERKLMKSIEDKVPESTDYVEIGKIENCEEFEAIWI